MVNKNISASALFLIFMLAITAFPQRPRTITNDPPAPSANPIPPAPETVKAKYEGGVFGYPHKMEGSLTLDDMNKRLVFRDGKQKEVFSVPYGSITGAYADTKAVRPAAATVASNIPSIYAIPAHFIKTKVRYLTLQYNDPDSNTSGVTSFKLENKNLLDSVLNTLAGKAGLTKRGDVFIKKKQ